MKKFSKKPNKSKNKPELRELAVVRTQRLEGQELLLHLKKFDPVKIKGYKYAF